MKTLRLAVMASLALAISAPSAFAEGTQRVLLQSKDWRAVVDQDAKGKICYAIAKPAKLEPTALKHGDVSFFVSSRPNQKLHNEPSVLVGYPLKENSKGVADVDGKKYPTMSSGSSAWLETPADEGKFLDAMKKGKKLTVALESARGSATHYEFSLDGLGGALDAAAKECK